MTTLILVLEMRMNGLFFILPAHLPQAVEVLLAASRLVLLTWILHRNCLRLLHVSVDKNKKDFKELNAALTLNERQHFSCFVCIFRPTRPSLQSLPPTQTHTHTHARALPPSLFWAKPQLQHNILSAFTKELKSTTHFFPFKRQRKF